MVSTLTCLTRLRVPQWQAARRVCCWYSLLTLGKQQQGVGQGGCGGRWLYCLVYLLFFFSQGKYFKKTNRMFGSKF